VISNTSPPLWIYSLLKQCDVKTCMNVRMVCAEWNKSLSGQVFWRFMVEVLVEEKLLFVPTDILAASEDSKTLFFELWLIKDLWTAALSPLPPPSPQDEDAEDMTAVYNSLSLVANESPPESVRFNIKVCARFRPSDLCSESCESKLGGPVILPLYQRVQLLQAAASAPLSSQDALKQIMREQGHTPMGDPWANAEVKFLEKEDETPEGRQRRSGRDKENHGGRRAFKAQVLEVREQTASVLTVAPAVGLREFSLDQVFDVDASQAGVYSRAARGAVVDVVNGFHSSVIVYGQTGSGKTFTMFGGNEREEEEGIVPRACRELLQALEDRRRQGFSGSLDLSYVEIFGGEVNDLLAEGGSRQVVGQSRVAGQRYVLDGQSARPVGDLKQMSELLARGEAQKRLAATQMNERSSRAHSVVMLSLTQQQQDTGASLTSRLFLADLGGSEKISKSGADDNEKGAGTVSWEEYYENRHRLQEAANINKGLFALKQCIDALNDREQAAKDGRPRSYVYIPYQDSKLTMLLSSALGGSSKTVVLVTGSLDPTHAVETLQTLRFAERCGQIENRADLSTRALREMLAALDREVGEVEELIKKSERWETRQEVRQDMEGQEVVSVSVLVGAEEHRKQLERLLSRRREMLGEVKEMEEDVEVIKDLEIPRSPLVAIVA